MEDPTRGDPTVEAFDPADLVSLALEPGGTSQTLHATLALADLRQADEPIPPTEGQVTTRYDVWF